MPSWKRGRERDRPSAESVWRDHDRHPFAHREDNLVVEPIKQTADPNLRECHDASLSRAGGVELSRPSTGYRLGASGHTLEPGFPFCPPDQGLCTPTRLSARQISSSHVVPLPAEAALDVEPTRAPAFRAVLRHRSTLVPFLRQAASLHSSRVSLPGQVAPRSSAACRRTAAGSDALPPGGASSTLRASPAGPRSSPAAAGDS